MMIKSFTAETGAAAMKEVRREMGGDAVVLRTRKVVAADGRPLVEVTACLDRTTVAQATAILDGSDRVPAAPAPKKTTRPEVTTPPAANRLPAESRNVAGSSIAKREPKPFVPPKAATKPATSRGPQTVPPSSRVEVDSTTNDRLSAMEQQLSRLMKLVVRNQQDSSVPAHAKEIVALLRANDVPRDFIEEFVAEHVPPTDTAERDHTVRQALVSHLSALMVPSLKFSGGERVMVLGLPGVGKSTILGKLATDLLTQGHKVHLAGLEFQKVGAHEELASYADLLQVDLTNINSDQSEPPVDGRTITLIDTPAIPMEPDELRRFADKVHGARPSHRIVVFSALTRSDDIADMAARMQPLAPTHVAGTMIDLTTRLGAMVAAARALGVKIVGWSSSPAGFGGLESPDPNRLAARLLPQENDHE